MSEQAAPHPQEEIPKTVIQDRDLSEEMAYGEKPDLEAAKVLKEAGLHTQAEEHLESAYRKGVEAGKKYLGEQQDSLDAKRANLEAAEPTQPPEQSTEASTFPTWEQSLEGLPAEQRKNAIATREALGKKYERPESDFSLVKTTEVNAEGKKEDKVVVALSSTDGIDLGNPGKAYDKKRNWNSIDPAKANDKFVVEVGGKEVDERAGLTLEVMKALTASNPDIKEWIWETGRPDLADELDAPIVDANGGYAIRYRDHRGSDRGSIAFRPAVVIEKA